MFRFLVGLTLFGAASSSRDGNGEWKLWREGEPFSQRFTGTFSQDGNTITGRWEIAEDGTNYETDFELILRRVGSEAATAGACWD